MIAAKSEPVFGGVYKLVALEDEDGNIIPKIKVSENVEKITNPGFKTLYRLFDKDNNKALADVITVDGEGLPEECAEGEGYEIFDPNAIWKRKTLTNFYAKNIRVPLFVNGECVYQSPPIDDIKKYCEEQMKTLWDEMLRFENPQTYYVDLSQALWDMKEELLNKATYKKK